MKAIDPTIKVGVSWREGQAKDLVNAVGPDLDFFAISNYATYGGSFAKYQSTDNIDISKVQKNLSINTVVSEYGATTWKGNNEDQVNSTGKGLVTFDVTGQFLQDPKCEYATFWNTRWYGESGGKFDGLNRQNELLPIVMPFKLWEMFLHETMVSTSSDEGAIVSYASRNPSTGDLSIFLINKNTSDENVTVDIISDNEYQVDLGVWRYEGDGYMDTNPTIGQVENVSQEDNKIDNLDLPGTSITAIVLSSTNVSNIDKITSHLKKDN